MYSLLGENFIREVMYPEWITNVVLLLKKGGKWRVCVDYTDLNKACPKDSFPLPRIDYIVDAMASHDMLSFLDAFSKYNQLPMCLFDMEKTMFITSRGLYYYKAMASGLKNASATYQRLVNNVFQAIIGNTTKVCINDTVIKSVIWFDHC